jgi:hypothetical protein
MSPSARRIAIVAMLGMPMPGAALTVAPSPTTADAFAPPLGNSPPQQFAEPAPDAGRSPPPLAARRLRLDRTIRIDSDPGLAFDGTLTVIPEPRVWALLIAGYALVGFALRKRRNWARHVAG